jgi:hypothetical protein
VIVGRGYEAEDQSDNDSSDDPSDNEINPIEAAKAIAKYRSPRQARRWASAQRPSLTPQKKSVVAEELSHDEMELESSAYATYKRIMGKLPSSSNSKPCQAKH